MRLYGKNPVIERLKSNPRSIQKIYVMEGHGEGSYIRQKAKRWGIPVLSVPASKIQKLARDVNTQGLLADIDDYAYVPYDELLTTALEKKQVLVFLDGITDPQNLGAAMRSLACLGGFALVLPTHDSVSVTESVLRVASGADNFIPVARVGNLGQAINTAKKAGFWIAGTVVGEGQDLRESSLPFPLGIVVGSEQQGIRDVIRKLVDMVLTIPMSQPRLSLNVAQAATIFCYEISRQQHPGKK